MMHQRGIGDLPSGAVLIHRDVVKGLMATCFVPRVLTITPTLHPSACPTGRIHNRDPGFPLWFTNISYIIHIYYVVATVLFFSQMGFSSPSLVLE